MTTSTELESFIEALRAAHDRQPSMRMGQLLVVAAGNQQSSARLFFMENYLLTAELYKMAEEE